MLNAFRGYYRPGDRIEVGDVFGDVYRIDVLTTTVWEADGPGKTVAGWQPTGALITFPNWEILRSNIINYSRDFPYIWDEVTFSVANESDLGYTVHVAHAIADKTVGHMMREPIANYRHLLERQRLAYDVHDQPQVYLALTDAFTNCTVRYLVPVQQRRHWSTELILAISRELERPEHRGRIIPGYPRTQVDLAGELRPPWSGPRHATVDAATSGGGPKAPCGTHILSRAIGDRFPRHQSCTAMRRLRRTKATNRFSGG